MWATATHFQVIGEEALAAGIGRTGPVGESTSHVFQGRDLVDLVASAYGVIVIPPAIGTTGQFASATLLLGGKAAGACLKAIEEG